MAELVPHPYSCEKTTHYSNRQHDSVTIPRCYKDVISSFLPHTAGLWDSLPPEYFPLTHGLNGFNSRINRDLLPFGSF